MPTRCMPMRRMPIRGMPERFWGNLQVSHLTNGGAVVDLSRSELQNTSFGAKVRDKRSLSASVDELPDGSTISQVVAAMLSE
jgi:hypothetical protein